MLILPIETCWISQRLNWRNERKLFAKPNWCGFIHSANGEGGGFADIFSWKFVKWIIASSLTQTFFSNRSWVKKKKNTKRREEKKIKGKKEKLWNRQWPNQRIVARKKRAIDDERLNRVIGWPLGRQQNRGPTECGVCFPIPLRRLERYKGGGWTSEGFNAWREEYGH